MAKFGSDPMSSPPLLDVRKICKQFPGVRALDSVDLQVQALELGNEPGLYGLFPWYRTATGVKVPGRPRTYDVPTYLREFAQFAGALPPLALAGPALGASKWMRNLGPFLSAQKRVRVVTLHRYPLQLCYTSTESLLRFAAPTALRGAF